MYQQSNIDNLKDFNEEDCDEDYRDMKLRLKT